MLRTATSGVLRTVTRVFRTRWAIFGEFAVIVGLYYFYEFLRSRATGSVAAAYADTDRIIALTPAPVRALEAHLRELPLNIPLVQHVFNGYYTFLHLTVTTGIMIWVLWRRPDRHRTYRVVLLAATGIALIFFWLFPVAPPRLTPSLPFLPPVQDQAGEPFMNPFAAFPSLHFAWAAWCAWVVSSVSTRRWARLVWIYPLLTAVVILATANHFTLDLVGGALVLGMMVAIAELLPLVRRRGPHPADQDDPPVELVATARTAVPAD